MKAPRWLIRRLEARREIRALTEAAEAAAETLQRQTAAMDALSDEIERNHAFVRSTAATENAALTKSLADVISGQIAGYRMPGLKVARPPRWKRVLRALFGK